MKKTAVNIRQRSKPRGSAGKRGAKKAQPRTPKKVKKGGPLPFPVVGIGASAGGLEAFSLFLQNLRGNLGMAYVYFQHISADHESFLPEILKRKTRMKVQEVVDKMPLEKDHVYVLPAKYNVTITDGKLRLEDKTKKDTFHSIDDFLNSLARTYQQNAIGVLLSGTGSDGTLGLMAIKAEGGITFAQDESAHYQAMPHHAIEMGYVDFVMPPDRIAKELAVLIQRPFAVSTPREFSSDHQGELRKIHSILKSKRGVDFAHYKQSTIHRRILRRMALSKAKNLADYAYLLSENKEEVDTLYQDLLITVTNFFREPQMYRVLNDKVLPALLKNRDVSDPIRIWVPGCATGEEAFSIAITIVEYLGEKAITTPLQIFATDLNEKAIAKARAGTYLKSAVRNVSPQRLRRFFTKIDGRYQVIKVLREMCVFAPHDLLNAPPFSKMDVISCQNVLIYLEAGPQNKIMHAFHYALKPSGFLVLGKSETIGGATDLFHQVNKQYKLYTKKQVTTPMQFDFVLDRYSPVQVHDGARRARPTVSSKPDLDKETDMLLLDRYVPASVLVNKDLEIVRFRGSISRFIEPASGKASLNLLKMVKGELSLDLRTVLHRAKREGRATRSEGIESTVNGDKEEISLEVLPLKGKGIEDHFLVIFEENRSAGKNFAREPKSKRRPKRSIGEQRRAARLESKLREAKDAIRIMSEDFEATREELQSANEEVLSSNEELQSINEELETSKEELQSTNEELTTINEELEVRNSELREAGDYTKAIIETMHEGLLMLTRDLKVKSANKGFYQMFRTTPEETLDLYLYNLGNSQWNIPELHRQLDLVQSRDTPFIGYEVDHTFPVIGLKSMLLNGQKLRTREGADELILLAIQDITSRKEMEEKLKASEEKFRLLVLNSSDIITVFDADGTIKYESPAIQSILGYSPDERVGRNIIQDSIVHPDDRNIKIDLLKKSAENPHENFLGEFRLRHKQGGYRIMEGIFRSFLDDNRINGIIANYRDVTDRKSLEQQKDEFIGIASHELKTPVTSIKAYAQILQDMFEKENDDKTAEMLQKMNAQVDRLTGLIVDLLDFTRLEGGKLNLKKENYNLNDLISGVVEDMQRIAKNHKIEMKLGKTIRMFGDADRTAQVLTNLLNNAIKYSPDAKKVLVSSKVRKDSATICVQDFGIGIRNELIDKVFDRFFRVTEPALNTFPGLGLGLYIASEIVQRQGGKIWAESEKGKGSTFCFSLPIKK